MICLTNSDEYLQYNKSYGGVKNGMLYSENAKIINRRLTISVTDMKPRVRQNRFGTSLQNRSSLFSRGQEFKGTMLGLAMALLRVYPKMAFR